MIKIHKLSLCMLTALFLVLFSNSSIATETAPQKAVFVTGANSGIGRNIAERLAAEGYFVYAGARKKEDIETLSGIKNVQGVRLDVTVQHDIDSAVELVTAEGRGLYAVVNNAGVVVMGLLAETDESELDFLFDVNVYGPYRMVKAFAPLLVESNGRIINISSMAGIMSPPAYGVYSMSKHAVEAFTDTLAYELGTVGVAVSAIAPGPFNSNAAQSICERRRKQDRDASQSIMPELAAELDQPCDATAKFPEPDPVADVVLQVLTVQKPKARYLAPSDPQQAEFIARNILQQLADLSSGQGYSLNREQLIDMLDAALLSK